MEERVDPEIGRRYLLELISIGFARQNEILKKGVFDVEFKLVRRVLHNR